MKIIKPLLISLLLTCALMPCSASAADYSFKGADAPEYYKPTLYEDVFDSEYNYGGPNLIDYYRPVELPGYASPQTKAYSIAPDVTVAASNTVTAGYGNMLRPDNKYSERLSGNAYPFTAASAVVRSDGSIGTVDIPSLGITVKAYEGTTAASMAKGIGHFSETSSWLGNVSFCGHNRGAKYNIGTIRNLKIGDTVTYTTNSGTRYYSVSFVGQISSTDWSYLSPASDNRITLITCLADRPSLRICVQAKERI